MRFRPLRGLYLFNNASYLGLAAQALCFRSLRELRAKFLYDAVARFAGFTPKLVYWFTAVITRSGRTMRSVLP